MNQEEYIYGFATYILNIIKENVIENINSLKSLNLKITILYELELLYLNYFFIDFFIHTLSNKAMKENNIAVADIFNKLRSKIDDLFYQYPPPKWNNKTAEERCNYYKEFISESNQDFYLSIGFAFSNKINNPDPLISTTISAYFKNFFVKMQEPFWGMALSFLDS